MTNANSFHSAVAVLLLFGVIYFISLGIVELKKWIDRKRKKK